MHGETTKCNHRGGAVILASTYFGANVVVDEVILVQFMLVNLN